MPHPPGQRDSDTTTAVHEVCNGWGPFLLLASISMPCFRRVAVSAMCAPHLVSFWCFFSLVLSFLFSPFRESLGVLAGSRGGTRVGQQTRKRLLTAAFGNLANVCKRRLQKN